MQVNGPEDCFRKGLDLLHQGRAGEAMPFFSAAQVAAAERHDMGELRERSLSYYGLCLGLTQRCKKEALHACRRAVERADPRPELWLNLARVAELARRRSEAHRALCRGLKWHAGHRGILRELKRMGYRKTPLIAPLRRSHPLNIALGKLRSSLSRNSKPKREKLRAPVAGPAAG